MGDLPQPKRLRVIDDIKAGKLHILVATDVAARGLDIEDLSLVVNYDLPNESENYVHRIGRTARMGKTGKAITLASEQDVYQLPGIERYIGHKIPSETATGDLLAEDKSEGKRIHTEYHEERGRDKDERRPRKDHRGPRERHKEIKSRTGAKHREDKTRTTKQGNGEQSRDVQHGVKLSELSLEERMAYYRQKYDKGGAPSEARQETGHGGQGHGGHKRDKTGGKNQRKGRGRETSAEADRSRTAKRGASPAQTKTSAPDQTVAQGNRPPEEGPAKKGMLSRLLGIFKK